jgi:ubiquinone/menaquinone biosynthesis C-methylase UbiE
MAQPIQDQWAQWLLERRHGGDAETQKAMLADLAQIRDKVLEHATVSPGDVLLDVGTGDGLIAFGALPLIGEHGKVIFSDISRDLLDLCQSLAVQMGMLENCTFLRASAEDLSALDTASVDVVTTRSVLIYVPAKLQAFQEFYRVLKPGGRLSIFEPINRFAFPEPPHLFSGYDVTPIQTIAHKVRAVYERLQPSETDPMLNFDERDLLALIEMAGFKEIQLELRAEITSCQAKRWDIWVRQSGNPKIPTVEEAIDEVLTPAEVEQFVACLRPLVEAGQGTGRMATAYVWAVKQPG